MYPIKREFAQIFKARPKIFTELNGEGGEHLEVPHGGFHHVWETVIQTTDEWIITMAWVTGGERNGYRYTLAVAKKEGIIRTGWMFGHKDYVLVRSVPDKAIDALIGSQISELLIIYNIPGFTDAWNEGPYFHHRDGWYSTGLFGIKVEPVDCIKTPIPSCVENELVAQPDVYSIREGIYIVFPDGSYRLMSRSKYRDISGWPLPHYRQGDLLVWRLAKECKLVIQSTIGIIKFLEDDNIVRKYAIDNHCINGIIEPKDGTNAYVQGPATIEHPEHGVLELQDGTFEVKLLPGTSRPFQGGID